MGFVHKFVLQIKHSLDFHISHFESNTLRAVTNISKRNIFFRQCRHLKTSRTSCLQKIQIKGSAKCLLFFPSELMLLKILLVNAWRADNEIGHQIVKLLRKHSCIAWPINVKIEYSNKNLAWAPSVSRQESSTI